MTGTSYGVAEAMEQLFWVSAALQTPAKGKKPCLNFAEATMTSFVPNRKGREMENGDELSTHIGTAHCAVEFKQRYLDSDPFPEQGHCWHNLFAQCVVAFGYPIPSRPLQLSGLEIPFDMMAAMANADRVTLFGNNLVVKGYSTALFPTIYEDKCIFWHMIFNEDGSRISFADDRIPVNEEEGCLTRQLRPDDVNHSRHIVGWSAKVRRNTGRP